MGMNELVESRTRPDKGGPGFGNRENTPRGLDRTGPGGTEKRARRLGKSWLMAVNTGE